jgi:PAS domain S-box-containing protein
LDDQRSAKTEPVWMLQLLLDTIPTRVFWKGRDSIYLGCNSLFAADAGIACPEDIVGKSDHDMPWKEQADMYVADDGVVMRTGTPKLGYEEPQTISDGRNVHLRVNKVPLRDGHGRIIGIVGIYEDITDSRNAEEQLRERECLYRTMFEHSPFSVALNRLSGEFVDVNERFVEIVGVPREEAIGRTPVELGIMDADALAGIIDGIGPSGRIDGYEIVVRTRRHETKYAVVSSAIVHMKDETLILSIINDITERRQAEESLGQSEEKYRELVQNANSIILRWERDGTIRFFNEFAQTFFGYTAEEILGRNVMGTIVPDTETSGRDLQAMIAEITAHPEYHGTNVNENIRKNGERVWIAWTNKPVFDERGQIKELLSVGLDITTRISDQQALQESEARYRSIFNSNVDAFLIFDTDGRIVDANARAAELYGYSRGDLIGLSGRSIVDPGSCGHVFQDFGGTALGEWFQREVVAIRKDGARFDVEVHGARLHYGSGERLLAIVFDVTERNRARELERRTEKLEARQARMKAAAAQKSSYFASMSHELRTPMTSIIGFTELLSDGTAGPVTHDQQDMLLKVSRNAHRLLGMLNDLLSLSRLESRRVASVISKVDLALLVNQSVQSISSLASAKGLDIVVSDLDAPLEVYTDDQKVSQILSNLLGNAIKFTASGSITVTAQATNDQIQISVTDTGVGISPSEQRRIFTEFYTTSERGNEKAPGAGLGLAITKKLCALLGGKIGVSSELGKGSTFTVVLPNRRP